MAMSGGGGRGDLNSEINVTPMVDVMLVLLVIFMVTAPMLQTAVDLQLPPAQAPAVQDDQQGKLVLSINKNGAAFLGDVPVKWEDLETKLSSNAKVIADQALFIQADKNLPYGLVLQTMAIARKAGVSKLLMMADSNDTDAPLMLPGTQPQPGPQPAGGPAR